MKLILKFGGSSVANATCIKNVNDIIASKLVHNKVYVVLSAFQGVTDSILELIQTPSLPDMISDQLGPLEERHMRVVNELNLSQDPLLSGELRRLFGEMQVVLTSRPDSRVELPLWRDEMLSFGERLSARIMVASLVKRGLEAEVWDARQVVLTNNEHGNAYVHYQRSYDRIRSYLKSHTKLQIITGFLGATDAGATTTLGRSGSDYSASIFGAALNVDEIEIWTDVDGILTANPTLVDGARSIEHLTYEEAMELAHAGAKVIFPPTMIPALYKRIPIRIKNTFNPSHPGSLISQERLLNDQITVGLSTVSHVSLLRLQGAGMVGVKGINARLFLCLAERGISIMLVSQAFSEHSTCLALKPDETEEALEAIETEFARELKLKYIDKASVASDLSLVAVVGEGMQTTPGIAGVVFEELGKEKINVEAIAQGASGRNLSFIVRDDEVKRAITALHKRLFKERSAI